MTLIDSVPVNRPRIGAMMIDVKANSDVAQYPLQAPLRSRHRL